MGSLENKIMYNAAAFNAAAVNVSVVQWRLRGAQ